MTHARLASVLVLLPACILGDVADPLESASAGQDTSASEAEPNDTDPPAESESSDGSETADAATSSMESTTGDDETGTDGEEGLPSAIATRIAVGRLHACAVTDDGAVRCWGYGNAGQLGNGAPPAEVAVRIPVAVEGLAGIVAISSFGDHTCAIDGDGAAWCWGANEAGQLGDGSTSTSSVPVSVAVGGFTAIDAGAAHTCALTSGGGVQCWGLNDYGQLGDGSIDNRSTPVDVVGLQSGVVAVTAGRDHSCAVSDDGTLRCWGGDTYGELGDGEPLDASSTPVVVDLAAIDVAAGDNDTCAIDANGGAWCWGKNGDGQLGNGESGTLVESHVPTAVVGLGVGTTAIAPGFGYTCAVASGATSCWGDNFSLTLGNGEDPGFQSPIPVDVVGLARGSVGVATCLEHTCALDQAGAVRCWGNNDGGGLGDGTEIDSGVPVAVVSLP